MPAHPTGGGVQVPEIDPAQNLDVGSGNGAVLDQFLAVRLTKVQRASIITRALCEGSNESAVIRRWLTLGAATEGVDLNSF